MTLSYLNTSKTVTTTVSILLQDRTGLTSKRKAYILTAPASNTDTIWLSVGGVATVGVGIPLYPGGSLSRFPEEEPEQDQFTAIVGTTSCSLVIYEESE